MLQARTTPNATGVTLTGDFDEFYRLYDAMSELIGDEDDYPNYEAARLRVLGFLYDLRHAYQGDREVSLVENHLTREHMKWHQLVASPQNVYYSFNTVWIEALFVIMALNDFVLLKAKNLVKNQLVSDQMLAPKVAYNESIAHVRHFQTVIMAALHELVSDHVYTRLLNGMVHTYPFFANYATQFVDKLAIKYIAMDKEKRLKNLSRFANQMINRSGDYPDLYESLMRDAKEYGCAISELELQGLEYPEQIEW
ncbi:hypothetical protein ABWW58_08825 [Sporolactobacillus sp. STCC-11]|uniref:DUF6904 family protein n=1 Tax=Sporolactobacillus caesalpiniae TaxID=3230362 RepID=UPI003396BD7C